MPSPSAAAVSAQRESCARQQRASKPEKVSCPSQGSTEARTDVRARRRGGDEGSRGPAMKAMMSADGVFFLRGRQAEVRGKWDCIIQCRQRGEGDVPASSRFASSKRGCKCVAAILVAKAFRVAGFSG